MLRKKLLPLFFGPTLIACSLVANLGDRTLADTEDSGKTGDDSGTGERDSGTLPVVDSGGGVAPAYCKGITLYASFDAKLAGDVGGPTTQSVGGVSQTASSKFGAQALSLVHSADTPDDGASLFFTGATVYPATEGSIAVWYRIAPAAAPEIPVLYRPVASLPPADLVTSGLTFYLHNDIDDAFGLHQNGGGAADRSDQILTFPVSSTTPYLKAGDYNHYFAAWRHDTQPTAFLALNGGLGTAFSDPGDVVYPDAATNGELLVPYRGFTSQPWNLGDAPVGLRLGGPGNNSPDGFYDDLVVWNRVLGFDEVAALYNAGKSIGQACGL